MNFLASFFDYAAWAMPNQSSWMLLVADTASASDWWVSAGIALIALTGMEIVLGIDNIVFISIVTSKLPVESQKKGRFVGLGLAMGMRVLLLCGIQFVTSLTYPLIQLENVLPFAANWFGAHEEINDVSWRDLILIGGGLFLIFKSVKEIDHNIDGSDQEHSAKPKQLSFTSAIVQILLLDIIFSLDSVITAVGMADDLGVMIAAVMIAVFVMMIFAGVISDFVERNPTVKMLALSFLLMIGVMLLAEGFGSHFNKGYVYFAMAFSLLVEILNLRMKKKSNVVKRSAPQ